jgi:hypothetical protein
MIRRWSGRWTGRWTAWLRPMLGVMSVICLVQLAGCGTGVESTPQGDVPVEEAPTPEYLKGEKAIQ